MAKSAYWNGRGGGVSKPFPALTIGIAGLQFLQEDIGRAAIKGEQMKDQFHQNILLRVDDSQLWSG